MLRRSFLTMLVVALGVTPASFALQEQQPDFSQLEKVVLEELKETNTPGATVAIVSGERVIYTKAFGISNVETGAPMTPDMLFRIGSTTKMFTATALVTFADNAASWPAGSMFTNVLDLSRFIVAFMNGGKLEGKQVLSPHVIAKLSTPQVSIPSDPNAKYGYGLMISNYRGVRVVEHGGSRSGYGSVIKMAPDHRFAVIVLGNRTGVALNKTAEKAMESMLPLKPKEAEKPKQELPMTAAEMANYTGKYGQRDVSVEILLKDGMLFLRQGPTEMLIRKIGENRFSAAPPGDSRPMEFALVTGADGKPEYFHAGLRAARRLSK